jgi:RHS repeat-associated protein
MKYKRNKDADITQDSLNYKYNAGTNQLQYITDNVASNVSTTDIDGQLPNNYIYDKSGNMVADNSQSMAVSWSPYGKILQNNKAGGANLTFGYNAMQQRVLKRVVLAGDTTRTYYIRDAQGNTMGVYTRHNDSVSWREQYIFGSSRLGLYRADTLVNKGLQSINKFYEGKRNYELTNHLGNVMVVINDRKADTLIGVNKGYNAVVISATDYFPFGMAIDSRSYTSSLYRYGFNGKENDKETGEQNYGMRIYDPRIAKFLSVDPIGRKYPELTPYQFASNTPIQAVDLDGLEAFFVAGAGGDAIGWNYTQRFKKIFTKAGFDFIPIEASHAFVFTQKLGIPPTGDMNFTNKFRTSPWVSVPKNDNTLTGSIDQVNTRLASIDKSVLKVVNTIKDNRVEGKQTNLLGYSYGSIVMAHAALAAADAGITIDNLILIGSPISDQSELYKSLFKHPHINNVIRYDIPGDLLSNPKGSLIPGAKQNSNTNGPHFDLARPDDPTTMKDESKDTNARIENLVKLLMEKGVKNNKN